MTDPTLADYLARAASSPTGDLHFALQMARSPEEMLGSVRRALKLVLNQIVQNRRHKQDHSEDALNTEIVSMLQVAGVWAQHDVKIGGHTDISIRMGDDFLWIAEAKIWKGNSWAAHGLAQLAKYCTGLTNQRNTALIFYVFQKDAAALLKGWREHLPSISSMLFDVKEVDDLRFISSHKLESTGTTMIVDHLAVPLYCKDATEV